MQELLDFYKGFLQSMSLNIDDRHRVYMYTATGETPYILKINGKDKQLILPAHEVLKNPDWDNFVAFHPLSENIARKDSAVFKASQMLVNLSLNAEIGLTMRHLIETSANTDIHSKLTPKQAKFLSLFPDADETSLKNWDKIEERIAVSSDQVYAKVITLRDKKLGQHNYSRVAYVTFPFYRAICDIANGVKGRDTSLFDVKLRKKDVAGFKALFEYIIADLDTDEDNYSFGSRSMIAPSFHALVNAYYNVASQVSKTTKLMKLDSNDLHWSISINDFSRFKGLIPPLDGNEGEVTEQERRRSDLKVAPPKSNKPVIINQQQPQVAVPTPQPVIPMAPPVVQQPQVIQVAQPQPVAPAQTSVAVANPYRPGEIVPATPTSPAKREVKILTPNLPAAQPQPMMPGYQMYPPQMGYPQPVQPGYYQQPMMQGVDRNGRPLPNMVYQTAVQQQPMQMGFYQQVYYR